MAEPSMRWLQLTRELARLPVDAPLPLRLCMAYVAVAEAQAGSISLGFSLSDRSVLCATHDHAARYENTQDAVREGPSLDAYSTGRPVTSSNPADQSMRWPALARAMGSVGGVQGRPIRPAHDVIGVLTVHYREDRPSPLTETEMQQLTDAIGVAIVGDALATRDEDGLWLGRDRVSAATGMVVAQLRIPPVDALSVLRAHAFAHDLSVTEVSRRILVRELDFTNEEGGTR